MIGTITPPHSLTNAPEEEVSHTVVQSPAPATKAILMVTLRHPLTNDTQVVPGTTAALVPWMNKGYQQVSK